LVLQAFEPEPLPIQFVYPSARLLSAKVRALVDMAVATRNWRFLAVPPACEGGAREEGGGAGEFPPPSFQST
jgi:hypothetical protein